MDSGEDSEGRGGEFGMREGCGALRGAAGPRPHPDGVADDPGALRLRDDVAVAQHIAVHLPVRHHDQHFVGPRAALREHGDVGESAGGKGGPRRPVGVRGPSPPRAEAVHPQKEEGRQGTGRFNEELLDSLKLK